MRTKEITSLENNITKQLSEQKEKCLNQAEILEKLGLIEKLFSVEKEIFNYNQTLNVKSHEIFYKNNLLSIQADLVNLSNIKNKNNISIQKRNNEIPLPANKRLKLGEPVNFDYVELPKIDDKVEENDCDTFRAQDSIKQTFSFFEPNKESPLKCNEVLPKARLKNYINFTIHAGNKENISSNSNDQIVLPPVSNVFRRVN